jgi:iron complex outermembrane receptor protein
MPTRFDTDLRVRSPVNGQLLITGSDAFQSENVMALEAGYRVRPTDYVSLDATVFGNRYDDLRSQEFPIAAGQPIVLGNGLNARTSGTELSASVSLTRWWQAHASYSYLWEHFSKDPNSQDLSNGTNEANDPSHLFLLRTSIDLPDRLELDATVRYASRLPQPVVKGYTELTARLGWQVSKPWELSLIGQNLLHDRHEEFAAGTPRELFERGVCVRAAWHF